MKPSKDTVPYSGIQTFLGRPYVDRPKGDEDVIVLGVPLDAGTSYMPGARFGPAGIRRASMIYKFYEEEQGLLDISRGKIILRNVKIVDLGDVNLPFGDQKAAMDAIYRKALEFKGLKAFRVFLGGDHSITYPLVKATKEEFGEIGLIQFDAHLDMLDTYMGIKYTHGSSIVRAIDEAEVKPENIFQIGIRGFLNSYTSYKKAKELGTNIITIKSIRTLGIEKTVEKIIQKLKNKPIYITFDIDSMDPGIAPGTGTTEPGGFTYSEISTLINEIFTKLNIVAMDVVEVAPLLDVNDITSKLAVSIILEALGSKFP